MGSDELVKGDEKGADLGDDTSEEDIKGEGIYVTIDNDGNDTYNAIADATELSDANAGGGGVDDEANLCQEIYDELINVGTYEGISEKADNKVGVFNNHDAMNIRSMPIIFDITTFSYDKRKVIQLERDYHCDFKTTTYFVIKLGCGMKSVRISLI